MRNKFIITSILFFLFCIVQSPVWAKYIVEESLLVATLQIDRTAPDVVVKYTPEEKTQHTVEVTITANEPIQETQGWTLQDDECSLKKQYDKNIEEEVEIKDKAGNTKKVTIQVNTIDKELPTIEIKSITNSNVAYPNYANQEAEIVADILVKDDQKIVKSLAESDVEILVNNK